MKLILLMLLTINSFALEPKYLKKGTSVLTISTGLYSEEKSYEKDLIVIDTTNQKGYLQTFSYKSAWDDRISYEIEMKALLSGTYTENYSGSLNFIADKDVTSYGLREPYFKLFYRINEQETHLNHSFLASFSPKLYEPKAHHFFKGRNELSFSYLFDYSHHSYGINGELFTKIYGKKEIRLDSGAEDTIESFTEAGIKFNPVYHLDKFSLHLLSSYSSMTDYNTKNSYFVRSSDKGYAVEIGTKISFQISKKHGIAFSYLERESYFNSIEEDTSRNIEYEIDSEEFKLSWWILM